MGSSIRATGNNEQMARSLGINTDTMKLLGLMISNGLVGLSGGLYALYGQATDVRVGTGAIVIALASIVIGEVIISSKKSGFALRLSSIIIGSIIYRIIVALVLQMGLNTDDLKLLTAILVGIALTIPIMLSKMCIRDSCGGERSSAEPDDLQVSCGDGGHDERGRSE